MRYYMVRANPLEPYISFFSCKLEAHIFALQFLKEFDAMNQSIGLELGTNLGFLGPVSILEVVV